jgi:DNA-binding transcriptional MerR regulator
MMKLERGMLGDRIVAEPPATLGISALAERAGVTPRTVRYYVAERLLPPPGGAGQQRVYTHEHLLRLKAIRRLKEAHLPLGEIRQRLAGLSVLELQRVADAPAPPPSSALEYIAAILATPPAQSPAVPPVLAAAPEPPRMVAEGPYGGRTVGQVRGLPEPPWTAGGALPGTAWRRVILAPGVELHYEPSGNRQRDAVIARLIREAAALFASLPQPSSPAP